MGWQYQHAKWVKRLKDAGFVQSMSRKGNCLDNGATEQVFGHLKDEFFRGRTWPDPGGVPKSVPCGLVLINPSKLWGAVQMGGLLVILLPLAWASG